MKRTYWTALIYGWVSILCLVLFFSLLLAFVIRYVKISEFTLSYTTLIIGLLTLFMGGLIAGVKGKENGWLLGSLTGIGFTLLTFFVQYLGFNEVFSLKQFIFHLTYILAAIVGSIVGVNMWQTKQ